MLINDVWRGACSIAAGLMGWNVSHEVLGDSRAAWVASTAIGVAAELATFDGINKAQGEPTIYSSLAGLIEKTTATFSKVIPNTAGTDTLVRRATFEDWLAEKAERAVQLNRLQRAIKSVETAAIGNLFKKTQDTNMPSAFSGFTSLIKHQRKGKCKRALEGLSQAAKLANTKLPAVPKAEPFRVSRLDAAHQLGGLAQKAYDYRVQLDQAPAINAGYALSRLVKRTQQLRAQKAFGGIAEAARFAGEYQTKKAYQLLLDMQAPKTASAQIKPVGLIEGAMAIRKAELVKQNAALKALYGCLGLIDAFKNAKLPKVPEDPKFMVTAHEAATSLETIVTRMTTAHQSKAAEVVGTLAQELGKKVKLVKQTVTACTGVAQAAAAKVAWRKGVVLNVSGVAVGLAVGAAATWKIGSWLFDRKEKK